MTSGYSISLIRDPARGASQLYLRVAWTSAFKQFFLTYYARPSLRGEGGCTKGQYQFQPCSRYQLSSLRGMASTLRMRVTISPGSGSHNLRADETKLWITNQGLVSSASSRRLWQPWTGVGMCASVLNLVLYTGYPGLFFWDLSSPPTIWDKSAEDDEVE